MFGDGFDASGYAGDQPARARQAFQVPELVCESAGGTEVAAVVIGYSSSLLRSLSGNDRNRATRQCHRIGFGRDEEPGQPSSVGPQTCWLVDPEE
jgi:hypothetical protein